MHNTPGLPEPIPVDAPEDEPHAAPETSELVYAGLGPHVVALDRGTGDLVWQWKAPRGKQSATVLVDGDRVLAAVDGYVYCLDAATGEALWENPLRGFGTGVTSLATRRGHSDIASQAAAAAAAAAAASAAAAG